MMKYHNATNAKNVYVYLKYEFTIYVLYDIIIMQREKTVCQLNQERWKK